MKKINNQTMREIVAIVVAFVAVFAICYFMSMPM